MTIAHLNRIGTAVPGHDIHGRFIEFVDRFLPAPRDRMLFRRMVGRAEIAHRYSGFRPAQPGADSADDEGFYTRDAFASTAARMARYQRDAPELAAAAVAALDLGEARAGITHLIVASCTGFMAPGLDQVLQERLGLAPSVERTLVGFMGCYAAVNALRLARHIVRSEPDAQVLVVNLELCTLHFQQTDQLDRLLSALLFGDGAAACLVSARAEGLALHDFRATTIADSAGHITWRIGDQGFDMHLAGAVPGAIAQALRAEVARNDTEGLLRGEQPGDFALWAVHAGGRTILDAVEQGLGLEPQALAWSRGVLRDFGNMSSATLMFVLQRILADVRHAARGFGLAFGPGLAAESFRFERVAA